MHIVKTCLQRTDNLHEITLNNTEMVKKEMQNAIFFTARRSFLVF